MDSWDERHESRRTGWMEQAPKKQNNEDLLTYYLDRQDAKQRCLCGKQKTDYFPLPRSVFMITDIQTSKEIIRKRKSNGRFISKEVIFTDEQTEYFRPMSPENRNLTDATSLVQEQGRQAASSGSTQSQSTDFRVPSGDRPTSKSSARRAEPTDLCDLAEDFSKKVYWLAAVGLLVTVGALCWTRLRHQLGNYYWLSLVLMTSIATVILSSVVSQITSKNAFCTWTVTVTGSVIIGIISNFYETVTIMQVGGITAFATLLLFLFALKTNKPLTNLTISTTTSILGTAGAIVCVLRNSYVFQALYALFGMLLFATDLTRTVAELESQPTTNKKVTKSKLESQPKKMQRSMDYAEAAQRLVISIAMIFFFTLLLVG
ncbi:protein lifeguard 1-like isoform X1 [Anas acuta]|uniref:protein lifeguard 1-like isoform X1 n=1 Tax=Anas acuta TaxID=28680 RepID=UPI0035C8C6BF